MSQAELALGSATDRVHADDGPLGAETRADGSTAFRVWAPKARQVDVEIVHPDARTLRLRPVADGYHVGALEDCPPGSRYHLRLDGGAPLPDPASRHQPEGVHGPSEVVAPHDRWTDRAWHGVPLAETVIYELHVGTYTEAGTFDALIPHLDALVDLGVTMVELMPVAQFSGGRNWGYDGVLPFATQDTYGGPDGLARLVDACHAHNLGVALDVVYNHLGPEGNILPQYGPYFTTRYKTPWGDALNLDGPQSDPVRRYLIENALYWIDTLHIDMLRLDAVHAILDKTARPFVHELTEAVHTRARTLRRTVQVIAESAANDPRLLRPSEIGGFGMDGQWNDDFHHALQSLLTGERHGYYADFGTLDQLATALAQGFVYTGQYSQYRGRRHGAPSTGIDLQRFVVFAQNHDQVGNRFLGERLSTLTDFSSLKLAAATICLSPSIPLLFMGDEHAETRPFLYFVSHTDPELRDAVRNGRAEEGKRFGWTGDAPDPSAEDTFVRSRIDHAQARAGRGRTLRRLYRTLLDLRRREGCFQPGSATLGPVRTDPAEGLLVIERHVPPGHLRPSHAFVLFNFSTRDTTTDVALPPGTWRCVLDTNGPEWEGDAARPLTGESFAVDTADAPVPLTLGARSALVLLRRSPESPA